MKLDLFKLKYFYWFCYLAFFNPNLSLSHHYKKKIGEDGKELKPVLAYLLVN